MSVQYPSLQGAFAEMKDFRNAQGKRYKLQTILVLASVAIMHGAQSEQEIAEWNKNHGRRWLRVLGIRRQRGPSQATIYRVFKGVDRSQLDLVLSRWSRRVLAAANSEYNDGIGETEHEFSAEGVEDRGDSLSIMKQWIGETMNQLPGFDRSEDPLGRESLCESLAIAEARKEDRSHAPHFLASHWQETPTQIEAR